MFFWDLLKKVTCDCKDNGEHFICADGVNTIKDLLAESPYHIIYEGNLSLIFAHRDFDSEEDVLLVSSHIDCVHSKCFSKEENGMWLGTWDNSATNAAVIDLMINEKFPANTIIAFTGDEEKNSGGAMEVMRWCGENNIAPVSVIVTDTTNEGWDDEAAFTIENDKGFDILSGFRIISKIQESVLPCVFVHDAEPDETWDYSKGVENIFPATPCLSVCLPVKGDMHHDDGSLLRPESIMPYQRILTELTYLFV